MMLSFGGKMPRDEGAVFVAANATVLGDVTLGRGVNIWYGAVLRADEGALILGENSNVQDNAVLHCDPGGQVVLGKNVTVGHSALVHGCTVGDNSLIGMHATILNHAVVGRNCIIGAGALVPEGMVIPDNSVAVGVPARVIKTIRDDQLDPQHRECRSLCGDGPSARGARQPLKYTSSATCSLSSFCAIISLGIPSSIPQIFIGGSYYEY